MVYPRNNYWPIACRSPFDKKNDIWIIKRKRSRKFTNWPETEPFYYFFFFFSHKKRPRRLLIGNILTPFSVFLFARKIWNYTWNRKYLIIYCRKYFGANINKTVRMIYLSNGVGVGSRSQFYSGRINAPELY